MQDLYHLRYDPRFNVRKPEEGSCKQSESSLFMLIVEWQQLSRVSAFTWSSNDSAQVVLSLLWLVVVGVKVIP